MTDFVNQIENVVRWLKNGCDQQSAAVELQHIADQMRAVEPRAECAHPETEREYILDVSEMCACWCKKCGALKPPLEQWQLPENRPAEPKADRTPEDDKRLADELLDVIEDCVNCRLKFHNMQRAKA